MSKNIRKEKINVGQESFNESAHRIKREVHDLLSSVDYFGNSMDEDKEAVFCIVLTQLLPQEGKPNSEGVRMAARYTVDGLTKAFAYFFASDEQMRTIVSAALEMAEISKQTGQPISQIVDTALFLKQIFGGLNEIKKRGREENGL